MTDEPCAAPLTCPSCKGQNTTKSIGSMLREIHVCRDCLRTFVIEKPPLRKDASSRDHF
jgi:transposase-like protein